MLASVSLGATELGVSSPIQLSAFVQSLIMQTPNAIVCRVEAVGCPVGIQNDGAEKNTVNFNSMRFIHENLPS